MIYIRENDDLNLNMKNDRVQIERENYIENKKRDKMLIRRNKKHAPAIHMHNYMYN